MLNVTVNKVVNGIPFTIEVTGNNVKITTSKPTTLEDVFSVSEEILKNIKRDGLPKVTAFFDDMGNLVIKEKARRRSVITKRYNLDRQGNNFTIPLSHILAYGNVCDVFLLSNY